MNAYLSSGWRRCGSSFEGSLLDEAPPVGRSFSMAPSSHISPKERLELFLSEEAFPHLLGHRCAQGACLPATSRSLLR